MSYGSGMAPHPPSTVASRRTRRVRLCSCHAEPCLSYGRDVRTYNERANPCSLTDVKTRDPLG